MPAIHITTLANAIFKALRTLLALKPRTVAAMVILILLPFGILQAESNQLTVVTSSQNSLHHLFITQLKSHLQTLSNNNVTIRVISIDDWQSRASEDGKLVLALGSNAALRLSNNKFSQPIIFSLLPSEVFQTVKRTNHNCTFGQCSAIFLDQPISRILALTRLTLPQLQTAGVLTSRDSEIDIAGLRSAASNQDIKIEHQQANDPNNLVFSLNNILERSDALLSLPDHHIYSRHTAQNILITAYRHRKPVIGYSRAFVKAGALFAVYSTPDQLSLQTAEIINQYFTHGKGSLPAPQHPLYYSVSVNKMVAKSLGINIQNETVLQDKLKASSHE